MSHVRNNTKTGTLTADASIDAADTAFVLAAAPAGSTGDYKATSLSPSGKWQVSTQTGAFSWAYDLRLPPVPGDLTPDISPTYSSNAVDGRTAATNSQPSWIGEGWNLWPGFIERSYKACASDLGGNNGTTKTGDLCWETDNATMSFGDISGELVKDGAVWRPKNDDGSKVERVPGAENGDGGEPTDTGEYWKVTTTDGTQYFFGQRTDSAWGVPVFGNDSGEPCNRATFDGSQCTQAYRWNLDRVVDVHGNSLTYVYSTESNSYGANMGARAASYIRGGTLARIDFGTRDGRTGQSPARVIFDISDRCLSNCGVHNATTWPDVPWDQQCTTGTCKDQLSPSFWSTKRLSRITTQVSVGSGNYRNVDQWDFAHDFPPPNDGTGSAALWLTGITHTGVASGSPLALPAVQFEGTMLRNRVDSGTDGLPALFKKRITTIKTESGGAINISYASPDCAPGSTPAAADSNTKRCFPVWWAGPMESTPRYDWFHKYIVASVVQDDMVGGNKVQVTNYDYIGGGAWAYHDNPFTELGKRTWSDWRGYEKVVVRKGKPVSDESKPESWTQHQYFRGMNGDKLAGGGSKSVNITDSTGAATVDSEQFAGFERETIVRNGLENGTLGAEVTGEIQTPWSRQSASQDQVGAGPLVAYQVENARTVSRTRLATGNYRTTRIDTTYDEFGNQLTVDDAGDTSTPADDRCTTTTYARNVGAMLVGLPSTTKTVGVACGTSPSYPVDAIADTRTYYDNGPLGAPPIDGDVTKTEVAKAYNNGAAAYLNDRRTTYDDFGRALETFDALGRRTTTSYTDVNGLNSTTTVTNALGHTVVTTNDPAWGLPTKVEDANQRVTSLTYDVLGRLIGVWKPGRTHQAGDSPHVRYTYAVRNTAPSWVFTEELKPNGNMVGSYALLDGFLRPRQTQTPSPQGGRILTDTLFDSRGLANVTRAAYYNKDAEPGTTLFLPNAGELHNVTVKVYDGAERETSSIYMKLDVEQWRTSTSYGGDHVSVTPPQGGTATTTFTDARGQTTALRQYRDSNTFDVTRYGYTKSGELASIIDPAGNKWQYDYDVLGRKIKAHDPDHGLTTMTYDDAGQLRTTTDARGKTVARIYDHLGRRTDTRLESDTGTLLTRTVYDTLAKGEMTSSTRIVDGSSYTRRVIGYDAAGRPTGEGIDIPAAENGLSGSYPSNVTYAADGSTATLHLPALGTDVPSETLVYSYNDLGLVNTVSGTASYVSGTTYTALGEPSQLVLGVIGKRLWRTIYREVGTRRMSEALTEREQAGGALVNSLTYDYDPIGNVTRITDRTPGSAADTQCFRYDYLRRASNAWTAIDLCKDAPSASVVGGPAPYWKEFTYDAIGNRRTQIAKGLAGAPDKLSTYTYPASGDGATQPHAVSSVREGSDSTDYRYDTAGNTTLRPGPDGPQTLTWDDEGQLATAGSTSYVYDAEGKQLLRRTPGAVTLYVAGGEIKLDTTTQGRRGTRYYESVGTRTSAGLAWTIADQHGTSQLAINSSSLASTPRHFDLFGNPRGTTALASTWPGGDRGFVGGITSPTSGLTRLGAREYDPALGKFISVDPIIDPNEPQQMNSYAYSNNNPATMSDPDGLRSYEGNDGRGSSPSANRSAAHSAEVIKARAKQLRALLALRKRMAELRRLQALHRIRVAIARAAALRRIQQRRDLFVQQKRALYLLFTGPDEANQRMFENARHNQGAFAQFDFDWDSDGCSHVPNTALWTFDFLKSCERHDFGGRNSERVDMHTEQNRARVDYSYSQDLLRVCSWRFDCQIGARQWYVTGAHMLSCWDEECAALAKALPPHNEPLGLAITASINISRTFQPWLRGW